MADDRTKSEPKVSYEYSPERNKMTYRVEKDGNFVCAMSINDRGYVFLYGGKEEKLVARLKVNSERELKNIGGAEQYQYVDKAVKLNSIDGLLAVYDKILNSEFTTYDETGNNLLQGEAKKNVGQLMTRFIDKYVLNTPSSQEVLHEYLQKADNQRAVRLKQMNRKNLSH